MPTPIAMIEALATLLWVFACLSGVAWLRRLWQLEPNRHVAAVTELLGNLVPVMILLVVIVLIGALVGLPSVVALIAVIFPAGLAYGIQATLSDLNDTRAFPILRVALTLLIGAAVILLRQVL
ncbi:hypothetical protein [Hasllibacter sp. MH4015]|uniref:hypothetical protein n=1 Tax=Hasllibacter sp. MH4015 TaxID=2854029 RepID=UPI001CD767F4|nr:hypothetical protein [Hasllibacter sp. MH4015]